MLCKCGHEMEQTSAMPSKFDRWRCRNCKRVIRKNKRLPQPKPAEIVKLKAMRDSGQRLQAIAAAYKPYFHELKDAVKFIDSL